MKQETINYLNQTRGYLEKINKVDYTQSIPQLSNATIGKHTRHFLECYQCLLQQQPSGQVCYDLRPRNQALESSPKMALHVLNELIQQVAALDVSVPLVLKTSLSTNKSIPTSVNRELLHNYEHTTHHLALIRVGLSLLNSDIKIPETFGFANSTIEHSKKVLLND